jgi:hypothetical protein
MHLFSRIKLGGALTLFSCLARSCHSFVPSTHVSVCTNRYPQTAGIINDVVVCSRVDPTMLSARKDPNDDDTSSTPFVTLTLPLVGLLALWPLLALFRDTNDPTSGFDIDMFMALKGIMDNGNAALDYDGEIFQLPPLSPAEQLVGAIFGPP